VREGTLAKGGRGRDYEKTEGGILKAASVKKDFVDILKAPPEQGKRVSEGGRRRVIGKR